jgi:hypothetical protein
MRKKYLIAIVAGSVLAMAVMITLSLSYLSQDEVIPPPAYAFASDRFGAGDIFTVKASGEITNVTRHPAADWEPAWSPDGTRLAFTSHRTGDSDIWVQQLAGVIETGEPQNLTNHPAWDYSPSWSPSGQSIAFVSERDGDSEIFVQSLGTETAIQLTINDQMDRRPAWSPDGKFIAFAAVRDGVERIHLVRPDGTDEQVATPPPLQGTAPAWSPDSQRLAFIGWDEQNRPGIYLIGPDIESLLKLYESDHWLGSLSWSADGHYLTFTSWASGDHDVYALPVSGGNPVRVTFDNSWDDSLVINPGTEFEFSAPTGVAQAAPGRRLPETTGLKAGVNLADLGKAFLVNDLGFNWAKGYVNWATVELAPGTFRWVDPDNVVKALGDQEIKILMRVHGTPAWARPEDSSYTHPPDNVADFAQFMTALATRYKGRVAAYEIWNEPNLHYEWGNFTPDPAAYTELLKAASTAVKAVDPDAMIISGGLATTGDGSPTAYGDLDFLQGMYDAGAAGHFDALGSHPYTFGNPPDEIDPWGLSLARVEDQRQIMLDNGDTGTPIWITELGWALDTSWNLGEHKKHTVTEAEQARFLADAYRKIQTDWPFVEAAFLFNLDFSTVPWYPAGEPMRWYAILNPNGMPRQAYTTLRQEMRGQ